MFPDTGDLAQARYNVYETSDGEWLALGALEEKFWTGFCERVGVPVTAGVDEVRAVMRGRTRDEWLARFADADVRLTRVYAPEEVAADPHVITRHATADAIPAPPSLGADTDAVLDAAGIDDTTRARLRAAEGDVRSDRRSAA